MTDRSLRQNPGPERIVADRSEWIRFQQRNMLERPGVIDNVRTKARENVVQKALVAGASQHSRTRHRSEGQIQLPIDFKQILLGRIQKDNTPRRGLRNRLCQRRSDISARAGNEYGW